MKFVNALPHSAPTAWVCGAVTIGDDVTIMHHVVVRGDVSRIVIGARVNLQDGTVVHTKTDVDLTIEDDVAVTAATAPEAPSAGLLPVRMWAAPAAALVAGIKPRRNAPRCSNATPNSAPTSKPN